MLGWVWFFFFFFLVLALGVWVFGLLEGLGSLILGLVMVGFGGLGKGVWFFSRRCWCFIGIGLGQQVVGGRCILDLGRWKRFRGMNDADGLDGVGKCHGWGVMA